MSKVLKYIAVFMLSGMLMLLTVGLPVTYGALAAKTTSTQNETSDKNPYSNSTEEKTPSCGVNITEEYVHDTRHDFQFPMQQISIAFIHAHEATYVAYHGELHCPPPNHQG